jgi:hypothetical protein
MLLTPANLCPRKKIQLSYRSCWQFEDFHDRQKRRCAPLSGVIVWGEPHLRRILRTYARYYNDIRTHWSLDKDAPAFCSIQRTGIIRSHAILGGLHHRYARA